MQRGRSPVSVPDLVNSGLLQAGQELRLRKSSTVAIVKADGKLEVGGRLFASPSTAAGAALGGTATNGWLAWCVESETGRRSVSELRQELAARHA